MQQKHQRVFDKCLWKNLRLGSFVIIPFLAAAQNHPKAWLAISLPWCDFKPQAQGCFLNATDRAGIT